jgi:hypothetical protein
MYTVFLSLSAVSSPNVKELKDQIEMYPSASILDKIDLNRGAVIIIALLSGGDYSKVGSFITFSTSQLVHYTPGPAWLWAKNCIWPRSVWVGSASYLGL